VLLRSSSTRYATARPTVRGRDRLGNVCRVFKRRLDSGDIKASRALEQNFDEPRTAIERAIKADIDAFRSKCETKWEQELFTQKRRLADAERSLASKETKKARESARIAATKIETHRKWLSDLRRRDLIDEDSRIFPMMMAPVIATIDGLRRVVPMRYTCRLAWMRASSAVSEHHPRRARSATWLVSRAAR
jgi:hypothetical protein